MQLGEEQKRLIAPNASSLAEAYVDKNLYPWAIYDQKERGWEKPNSNMVGFTMYQLDSGVGFVLRLMIDERYQGKGYGEAAMREVIRKMKLCPAVEMIGTSHHMDNQVASALYKKIGFVPWDIGWAKKYETEVYLRLKED